MQRMIQKVSKRIIKMVSLAKVPIALTMVDIRDLNLTK